MTTGKRHIPINNQDAGAGAARERPEAARSGGPRAEAYAEAAETVMAPSPEEAVEAAAGERDALAAEREALAESLLRLRAEFENFRKRASRELVEARVRAQGELLGDLLPVLDNLERALDAAEHHEEGKVLDGVRLTRDLFVNLLVRAGVEEVDGVGATFDPEVHEAMLVQPSEYEEGLVAAVCERGYRQGERVLRPARVIVSAGPAGGSPAKAAGPDGPGAAQAGSSPVRG